jgi:hypothetical protein
MKSLADWVDQQFDLNPAKKRAGLARAFGIHPSQITRMIKHGRRMKVEDLEIISGFFGTPIPREYTASAKPIIGSFDPDDKHQEYMAASSLGLRRGLTHGATPEYDVRGGASRYGGTAQPSEVGDANGNTYSADQVKAEWIFPEDWLKAEMRLSLSKTDIVAVDGPSMEPDLNNGDRVLIDRSNRDPRQGAIFVIREGESIIIKHVDLVRGSDPQRIICKSSNPRYGPFELILDGVENEIIGRVAGRISKL